MLKIIIIIVRCLKLTSWNWVVTRAAKWVAAQNTFKGEPSAFEWSVFGYGLLCILRTRWRVTTGGRRKWRNAVLVEFYQQKEKPC